MANLNTIGGIHYEMMRRSYNQNAIAYSTYGAKGITVCQEWHNKDTFRSWAMENGFQKGLRINRKDSSKGYFPDNCYFGTKNKAKHGYSEYIKKRAEENKSKKRSIGVKRKQDSPLYKTYMSMLDRCRRKKHIHYKDYGGRGISVCNEWTGNDGFYNFVLWSNANGWENGLSLDRIDNNKGYSPDNCRWVPWSVQEKNKRNVVLYYYKGLNLCVSEIARMENVSISKLFYRIKEKRMSIEDAINDIKKGENK
jgi:hypothetical protein